MHALEKPRIEHILEIFHGAAQNMRLAARMNAHVITGRIDPLDRRHGNPHDLAALPDRQHFGMARLDGLAAALQKFLECNFPASGYFRDESKEPVTLLGGIACLNVRTHFLKGSREAILIDGLQEIVDGARLESANGVLVVGGDKYDQRHRLVGYLGEELESRDARHLDVQKYEIRLVSPDRGQRIA